MVLAALVVATVVDLALATLLVGISGFVVGSGPESMGGGPALTAGWIGLVVLCIAAPIAAFAMRARRRPLGGMIVAWLPPLAALGAVALPSPY